MGREGTSIRTPANGRPIEALPGGKRMQIGQRKLNWLDNRGEPWRRIVKHEWDWTGELALTGGLNNHQSVAEGTGTFIGPEPWSLMTQTHKVIAGIEHLPRTRLNILPPPSWETWIKS
jgi:hypothetical protein